MTLHGNQMGPNGQAFSFGVWQVTEGQDDTDLVAAYLAATAQESDEVAAERIGAKRSAVGSWRAKLDAGQRIRLKSYKVRTEMRRFTFSGGSGHQSYRDGVLAALTEVRGYLDELERRLTGGKT